MNLVAVLLLLFFTESSLAQNADELDEDFSHWDETADSVDQIEEVMKTADAERKEQQKNLTEEKSREQAFASIIDYLEEEEAIIEQEKKRERQEVTKKFSDTMKDLHTNLSENIIGVADKIDSFFINKSITDGRNRTNIRLTNITSSIEEQGIRNDFDFKLRLRLPQLKRRIQIEFEDDALVDDKAASRDNLTQNNVTRSQQQGGSRGGLSFYQRFIGLDAKLSSGVEVRSQLIVFARFRLSKDFVLTPKQKITFIHDVFDDTVDNKGQIGILNYDYSFNKFYMLRFSNEENYRDNTNTFQTTHGLSLFHPISDRNFISYNYRVESINPGGVSSFYLNTHVLNVSFRRKLYREHLFYETGPGLVFPKSHDFEGLWAFVFKLEVIFGNV
ncbi:hypothetical protein K2X05_11120 [bacterium]|nr:hypothetical protein [bacterium]